MLQFMSYSEKIKP